MGLSLVNLFSSMETSWNGENGNNGQRKCYKMAKDWQRIIDFFFSNWEVFVPVFGPHVEELGRRSGHQPAKDSPKTFLCPILGWLECICNMLITQYAQHNGRQSYPYLSRQNWCKIKSSTCPHKQDSSDHGTPSPQSHLRPMGGNFKNSRQRGCGLFWKQRWVFCCCEWWSNMSWFTDFMGQCTSRYGLTHRTRVVTSQCHAPVTRVKQDQTTITWSQNFRTRLWPAKTACQAGGNLVLKIFLNHTTTLLSGSENTGPHNDVGEMLRSGYGTETSAFPHWAALDSILLASKLWRQGVKFYMTPNKAHPIKKHTSPFQTSR